MEKTVPEHNEADRLKYAIDLAVKTVLEKPQYRLKRLIRFSESLNFIRYEGTDVVIQVTVGPQIHPPKKVTVDFSKEVNEQMIKEIVDEFQKLGFRCIKKQEFKQIANLFSQEFTFEFTPPSEAINPAIKKQEIRTGKEIREALETNLKGTAEEIAQLLSAHGFGEMECKSSTKILEIIGNKNLKVLLQETGIGRLILINKQDYGNLKEKIQKAIQSSGKFELVMIPSSPNKIHFIYLLKTKSPSDKRDDDDDVRMAWSNET